MQLTGWPLRIPGCAPAGHKRSVDQGAQVLLRVAANAGIDKLLKRGIHFFSFHVITTIQHYYTRFNRVIQHYIAKNSIISCRGDTMKPVKKSISVTLDYPILEKIQHLAENDDRSVSSYINLVLREHLERLEKKKKE